MPIPLTDPEAPKHVFEARFHDPEARFQFRLNVFDGTTTTSASFAVYLLTPAEVVRDLIDAMDKLELEEGIHIRARNSLDTLLGKAAQFSGEFCVFSVEPQKWLQSI